MPHDVYYGKTLRKSFARTQEIMEMPNLLEVQKNSYKWFLEEGLQEGETGVFLETAHPAKFLETVEGIIGDKVEIPAKLQAFMKGTKQSIPMAKDFESFKAYLLKE